MTWISEMLLFCYSPTLCYASPHKNGTISILSPSQNLSQFFLINRIIIEGGRRITIFSGVIFHTFLFLSILQLIQEVS